MPKQRYKSLTQQESALQSLLADSENVEEQADNITSSNFLKSLYKRQSEYKSLALKNKENLALKVNQRKSSHQLEGQKKERKNIKKLMRSVQPTNFRKLMNIQFSNKNINGYSLPKITNFTPPIKVEKINNIKTINFSELAERISQLSLDKGREQMISQDLKKSVLEIKKKSCLTLLHKKKVREYKKRGGYYIKNLIIEN